LQSLEENDLDENITKTKNDLTKQYVKIFEIDDVKLEFEEDALRAIAQRAMERKTGARGLRSIIESTMLDIMFELPSRDDIEKCIITKATVLGEQKHPTIVYTDGTVEENGNLPKESA